MYKASVANVITTTTLAKGGKSGSTGIGTICGEIDSDGKVENALYAPSSITSSVKGGGKGKINNAHQLKEDNYSFINGVETTTIDFLNGYSMASSYSQWGALVHNPNDGSDSTRVLSYLVWTGYTPAPITREGHNFEGWYSYDNLTVPHSEGPTRWPKIFSENTDIYAKWTCINYTIEFHVPYGNAIEKMTVPYATTLQLPTPTSANRSLIFDDWYEGDQAFNLTRMPARDVSLMAKWIEYTEIVKYLITFNTSEGGSHVGSLKLEPGEIITIPAEAPTKEGYSFEYWYETDPSTKFTETVMPERDLTLHAKWTLNTYYMSFDTNGGDPISTKEVLYNEPINLPSPTNPDPTLTFDGWFEGDSFFMLEIMPARNVSLTAMWETETAIKYFITFDTGEGGSYVGAQKLKAGTTISNLLSAPIKVGCSFAYWYETDPSIMFTETVMPERNLTLHAKWTLKAYIISFDTAGGNPIEEKTVNYSEPINLPDPTNENSTLVFDGWFENGSLFDLDTMPARNIFLVAQWKYVPKTILKHYVTFITGEGGSYVGTLKLHEDDPICLSDKLPEKEGHTFVCWCKSEDSTIDTPCFADGEKMPGKSITLYAVWSINNYTITFDTNGINPIAPINGEYNSPIVLENATQKGRDFYYWYEDNALAPFSLAVMPARNITLYPYFMNHKYALTFIVLDDGNDTFVRNYVYEEPLYTPIPKRTGYIFSHWRIGGVPGIRAESYPFNYTEMPDQDLWVWADWDTSKTVLVYETGDDEDEDDDNDGFIAKDSGSAIDTPYVPQRKGKQFCGWYKDETFKEPFNETSYDFSSKELVFAKWC